MPIKKRLLIVSMCTRNKKMGRWKKDVKASTTVTDTNVTIEDLAEKTEIKSRSHSKSSTKIIREGLLEAIVTTGSQTPVGDGSEEVKERTIQATAKGTTLSATWDAYDEATSYRVDVYKKQENGSWKKDVKASATTSEPSIENRRIR